jgi:hypothetical protein
MKPGPKTEPFVGPLQRRTMLLDDLTWTMLGVLGDGNASKGARVAARHSYAVYQAGRVDPRLPVAPAPLDMVLHCPSCGAQHVDAADPETGWANPPHRSHLCHACGVIWRPADVPTNGVAAVQTRGAADTFTPTSEPT